MDNQIRMNQLYDYYSELLTDKQKIYFEDYYFDNLTITEMSENHNVSRNAIHKQLKEIELKLNNYEEKLNLFSKANRINKIISKLDEKTKKEIEELI